MIITDNIRQNRWNLSRGNVDQLLTTFTTSAAVSLFFRFCLQIEII